MPQQIGRFPQGFLGLLDSKNRGKTPNELEDTVRPVVDMTDFWALSARKRFAAQTSAINLIGFWGAGQLLARGETGILYGAQARSSTALPAGTSYALGLYLSWVDETTYISLNDGNVQEGGDLITAGNRLFCGWTGRYLLRGPVNIGVAVSRIALGTATQMFVTADVAVFPE